jgi:hypothetical protein
MLLRSAVQELFHAHGWDGIANAPAAEWQKVIAVNLTVSENPSVGDSCLSL